MQREDEVVELPDDVERQLAAMSDADWDGLTARLRAPDAREAFRDVAARYISGQALETIAAVANISQFVGDDGEVDEARVARQLRVLFDLPPELPRHQDFGQFTGQPDMGGPGDRGRAAAAQRFGDGRRKVRASAGAAEAKRRFGKDEEI